MSSYPWLIPICPRTVNETPYPSLCDECSPKDEQAQSVEAASNSFAHVHFSSNSSLPVGIPQSYATVPFIQQEGNPSVIFFHHVTDDKGGKKEKNAGKGFFNMAPHTVGVSDSSDKPDSFTHPCGKFLRTVLITSSTLGLNVMYFSIMYLVSQGWSHGKAA